jgi:hypothetical protein
MSMHSSDYPANRLNRILALDGPEFLGQAYLLMLGRPIDAEGFRNYDAQLRAGTSKLSILAELRGSQEGRSYSADTPDPLVFLAQALPVTTSPTASLQDMLRMNGSAFIVQGFVSITGRIPEEDAGRHYVARLNAGADKLDVLLEILEANRGPSGTPELRALEEAISNMRGGLYPVAMNIGELLALDDFAFIDCAYKTLLRRAPDAVGFANNLRLIRSGTAKMRVVSQMCFSAEGGTRSFSLPGLKRAILQHWLAVSWLTGWWYRPIARVEGETPLERRLRVVENTLVRMVQERERESCDLEAAAEDVARMLKTLTNRRSA